MYGSGGNEECFAGVDVDPVQLLFDGAGLGVGVQLSDREGLVESEGDLRGGAGAKDMPHFGFAVGLVMLLCVGIARVDLDGEPFGGEEEFDE